MYLSPTKAIKMYNVSKPTLYSDMKTGKLSYEINDRKKRKINIAELDRLYDLRKTEEGALTSNTVKSKANLTEVNTSKTILEKELEDMRKTLSESHKREITLLSNQIEQLQNQLESVNQNLNKALDITALLEDKREGQGEKEIKTEAKLEVIERELSKVVTQNHRLQKIEQKRRKKIELLEKEIKEKNKNWFNKLFG